MDIRNRMADIVKLRCNICQDFLQMLVKPDWQQQLYNKARNELNGKFRDKYIAVYEKMRDIGYENYTIKDMDVTLISEVIIWSRIVSVEDQTKDDLRKVVEDRNTRDHSNENEEPKELYLQALLHLEDLKHFVKTIDRYETTIDDYSRQEFRKNSLSKIEDIEAVIDDEYIQLVYTDQRMDMDIQRILNSKNPQETMCNLSNLYFERAFTVEKDSDLYFKFMLKLSDANFTSGHHMSAHYFLMDRDDIKEGERRLQMLYDSCESKSDYIDVVNVINSYVMKHKEPTELMSRLLTGIQNKGYDIVSTPYPIITESGKSTRNQYKIY